MTQTLPETLPDPDGPPALFLTQALQDLYARRRAEEERHEREIADFDAAIRQTLRERELVVGGLSLETVRLAESILVVQGQSKVGDGPAALGAAIADLAAGAPKLRQGYIGTKNYDRWRGQRCDGSYGTAPSYGSLIFTIYLANEYRDDRARMSVKGVMPPQRELTPEQLDAGIRYLVVIQRDGVLPV